MEKLTQSTIDSAERLANGLVPSFKCEAYCICKQSNPQYYDLIYNTDPETYLHMGGNMHCYVLLKVLGFIFDRIFGSLVQHKSMLTLWNGDRMIPILLDDIPNIVERYSAIMRRLTKDKKLKQILAEKIKWTTYTKLCFVPDTNVTKYYIPYKDTDLVHSHTYRLPWTQEECDVKVNKDFITALVTEDFREVLHMLLVRDLNLSSNYVIMVNTPKTVVNFMRKAFDAIVLEPKDFRHKRPPFVFKHTKHYYIFAESAVKIYPDSASYHEAIITDVTNYPVYRWVLFNIHGKTQKHELPGLKIVLVTSDQYKHMHNPDNHVLRSSISTDSATIVKFNDWREDLSDLEQRMLISWALSMESYSETNELKRHFKNLIR